MTYRVTQWGTGNVGYHSLRHIIEHPDYELVGLHAHSNAKIGKDAAEIVGLGGSTGTIATSDVAFGFGRPESDQPIMSAPGVLKTAWGGMVQMIADRLGLELDEIRESYERVFTNEAFDTSHYHPAYIDSQRLYMEL